jgi:hypothetical protein
MFIVTDDTERKPVTVARLAAMDFAAEREYFAA